MLQGTHLAALPAQAYGKAGHSGQPRIEGEGLQNEMLC